MTEGKQNQIVKMNPYYMNCIVCSKRVSQKERRPLVGNKDLKQYLEKSFFLTVCDDSVICNKCRQKYYFELRQQNVTKQSNKSLNSNEKTYSAKRKLNHTDEEKITLQICTTGQSHSRCFICGKPGPKLVRIKKEARHDVFIDLNIILAKGARCCPKHLNENSLCKEAIMLLKNNTNVRNKSHFTCEELNSLLENIRKVAKDNRNKRVDFDDNGMNDSDYESLTGLNKAQFDDLLTYVKNSKK